VIVVDTSVWVAAFRSASGREAVVLKELIDADEVAMPVPVRSEILAGASGKDRQQLQWVLAALPMLYPTDDTWHLIDAWTDRARQAGQSFGVGDLLIAGLASEAGALVWSLDSAFERMEKLKFVGTYGGWMAGLKTCATD
jgi:predicted nucleic acid-binding protein